MRSLTAAGLVLAAAVVVAIPRGADGDAFGIDIGDPVPELRVKEVVHGDPWPERRRERLVRLIQVFRTWSSACAAQSARLDELHREFEAQGLHVVAVTNEHPAAVKAWVEEHRPAYRVVVESTDSAKRLGLITGVPTAYLAGVDGRLVWKGNWAQEGRDAIPPLLRDHRVRVRPRLPPSLSDVSDMLRLHRFAPAMKRIARHQKRELSNDERTALAGARRWIESLAAEDLAAAELPLRRKRYYEASRAYEELEQTFAGTEAARSAEKSVKLLMRDPDSRGDIRAGRDFHEALAAIEGLKLKQAVVKLRLMMFSHRDTRFGKLAEEHVKKLEAEHAESSDED